MQGVEELGSPSAFSAHLPGPGAVARSEARGDAAQTVMGPSLRRALQTRLSESQDIGIARPCLGRSIGRGTPRLLGVLSRLPPCSEVLPGQHLNAANAAKTAAFDRPSTQQGLHLPRPPLSCILSQRAVEQARLPRGKNGPPAQLREGVCLCERIPQSCSPEV